MMKKRLRFRAGLSLAVFATVSLCMSAAISAPGRQSRVSDTAGAPRQPHQSAATTAGLTALPAGHLYVGARGEVPRYPIVKGIVASQPDGTLKPAYAPVAIGQGGGLYVTQLGGGPSIGAQVQTYSTPDMHLLKTLNIAFPEGTWTGMLLTSLAVDPKGYLFVGYYVSRPPNTVRHGIFVYPPFAKGNASPIAAIRARTSVSGLATDAVGDLFVSLRFFDKILVYATPTSQPTLVRALSGRMLHWPGGLRIDSSGELYVACSSAKASSTPYVLAYPDTASGNPEPDRRIAPSGVVGGPTFGTVSTDGAYLFLGTQNGVYELKKQIAGEQRPVAQLSVSSGTLTVGP
jgi:hypothetical protein